MKTLRNVFRSQHVREKANDELAKLRVTEKGGERLASYHSISFRCIQGQQESKSSLRFAIPTNSLFITALRNVTF